MDAEQIEAAKSRDSRLRLVDAGFSIQADMRDNETVRAILAAVQRDADQAMDEMADLSPADIVAVSRMLVRVQTQVFIRRALMEVIQRSEFLAQQISTEDSYREDAYRE